MFVELSKLHHFTEFGIHLLITIPSSQTHTHSSSESKQSTSNTIMENFQNEFCEFNSVKQVGLDRGRITVIDFVFIIHIRSQELRGGLVVYKGISMTIRNSCPCVSVVLSPIKIHMRICKFCSLI